MINPILLILSLFGNLWIFKILSYSFLLGVLILISCYLLQKNIKLFIVFLIPLIFFQIKTTQKVSLTNIGNDDRRLIDLRLRAYPPRWLRLGYWLEERPESIAFFRFTTNVFENIDPNLYFFANSPRQRVGITEFEKFPYVLVPIFLLGIFSLLSRKNVLFWAFSFFVPILILGFIGNNNNLGPFLLFPFFTNVIYQGLTKIRINSIMVIIFILVLVQIISYQIHI